MRVHVQQREALGVVSQHSSWFSFEIGSCTAHQPAKLSKLIGQRTPEICLALGLRGHMPVFYMGSGN